MQNDSFVYNSYLMQNQQECTGKIDQPQGSYQLPSSFRQLITSSHIPLRKKLPNGSKASQLEVFTEEMAYLMMTEGFTSNHKHQKKLPIETTNTPMTLLELYQSLGSDPSGYHTLQSIYFYLKLRKLSKLLYREPIPVNEGVFLRGFKVFGKVEDYEKNVNGKKVVVLGSEQKVEKILRPQVFEQNGELTIYITASMDGIFLKTAQPFKIFLAQ